MRTGPSTFRCSCGEIALKITGVVGGRMMVRCPSCGASWPINEHEPEPDPDPDLASLLGLLRDGPEHVAAKPR